jgi:NADH:ubiquinone oxidoreductase subunit 5 (subunit L)/multisubunit Na+/H+ antiporter MnhA subunit
MIPFAASFLAIVGTFMRNHFIVRDKEITIYMFWYTRTQYRLLSYKWYFDVIYNRLVNSPLLISSYRVVFALIDKGLLESVGPTGLARLSHSVGSTIITAQTGRVYEYAWIMLLSLYTALTLVNLLWY